MNREIKFRGKQENSNRWITGCLIQYESGDVAIFEKMMTKYGYEATQITKRTKVNSDTIGQFTGLTDKNGKEIYEGDILKADYYDTLHEVVFSDTVGAFMLDEIPSTGDIVVIGYEDIVSHFEVIGNIYDNQDLLEG